MTSFAPVLAGLGLRCLLIEDQEATARLKNRLPPRNGSYVRGTPSIVLTVRFFQKIGRRGAQARIDNSTKAQRQQWARRAAITRWRKHEPCAPALAPRSAANGISAPIKRHYGGELRGLAHSQLFSQRGLRV